MIRVSKSSESELDGQSGLRNASAMIINKYDHYRLSELRTFGNRGRRQSCQRNYLIKSHDRMRSDINDSDYPYSSRITAGGWCFSGYSRGSNLVQCLGFNSQKTFDKAVTNMTEIHGSSIFIISLSQIIPPVFVTRLYVWCYTTLSHNLYAFVAILP